jgi:ubiquinone/menaquinone biosynthesis C-methylase UbiE
MRHALLALLVLATPAFAEGIPAEMRACVNDADCVALPDACGPPSAVNKAHLEAAAKLVEKRDCPAPAASDARPSCSAGSCTMDPVVPDPTGHLYDEPAEEYARSFDYKGRDKWQKPRHVVELLRIKPGMTVVDLGAGTGYFEGYLDRAVGDGGKVIALDVTPTFTDYLVKRGKKDGWKRVSVKLARRDDPGLEPESVDRVLIVDTWHHIGARDAYAKKLAAALRPGGAVMILEVSPDSPHGPGPAHRLAPEVVIRELDGAGLTTETVKEKLPRHFVIVGRKPAP